jgi:hypothetical protein
MLLLAGNRMHLHRAPACRLHSTAGFSQPEFATFREKGGMEGERKKQLHTCPFTFSGVLQGTHR